jgi:hypothetical protein
MKFCEWLIQFGDMCHITTWEEDYKGNNTSPSLQSPLANFSSPSCTYDEAVGEYQLLPGTQLLLPVLFVKFQLNL